jgi:hypothetical protein
LLYVYQSLFLPMARLAYVEEKMIRTFAYLLCVIGLVALLSSCDTPSPTSPSPTPPAAEMLPTLSGYNVVEGQLLTDYMGTLSGGAALLAGHPELAATIGAVDQIISCYQEIGAVRARVYSNQAEPLSAGAVAIADRNQLLDPTNLFNCTLRPLTQGRGTFSTRIEPCSASYTLARGDNEFYILYAGSTAEVCQAFCTNLEGCTAHR